MMEKKKQELAAAILCEVAPEIDKLAGERDAARAEVLQMGEHIKLALFHLDEDDPVKSSVARAREILLSAIAIAAGNT